MKWWNWMLCTSFFECWVLSQIFHSPLPPSPKGSFVPLHFLLLKLYHLHIGSCWYFSQQSWLQDSSLRVIQPAFYMMYSAYNLNKQGDNIQPWCTLFPIWNQSVVPCLFLTAASWPAYRFHRRQVRWSGIPISLRIFHSLLLSTLMAENEEELKSLLMKVKEESEKVGLKLNIQKMKIMVSGPITSWEIDGETVETVSDYFWGGLQNHCRWWLQPWN